MLSVFQEGNTIVQTSLQIGSSDSGYDTHAMLIEAGKVAAERGVIFPPFDVSSDSELPDNNFNLLNLGSNLFAVAKKSVE